MNTIQEVLLNYGLMLPDWAFWALMVAVWICVIGFYVFGRQVKTASEKYDIPFDKVDGMVRMMASLAIRLYVLKKGVEETQKVDRIRTLAGVIDSIYPVQSNIRLSQLVYELEKEMNKKFSGSELTQYKAIVEDIQANIVKELIPVGSHIHDNEKDPYIDPREVSAWINKGVRAVDFVQK